MTALGPDPATWPYEARAFYVERRAIREYDGKLPRARADIAAEQDTRSWWLTLPKENR